MKSIPISVLGIGRLKYLWIPISLAKLKPCPFRSTAPDHGYSKGQLRFFGEGAEGSLGYSVCCIALHCGYLRRGDVIRRMGL